MTTRSSSIAEGPYAAPLPGASGPSARRDAAPYVQPATGAVDAVLIDAIRASSGPYVPAPWRAIDSQASIDATAQSPGLAETPSATSRDTDSADVVAHDARVSTELPWIDAFLDAAPSTDVTAIPVPPSHLPTPVSALFAADVERPADDPRTPTDSAESAPEASGSHDEWPLDEAGAALRQLAEGIAPNEPSPAESSNAARENAVSVDPPLPIEPLPMWADDDLMDIMPVKATPNTIDAGDHWAGQARREPLDGGTAAAAAALEGLARRLRDGELTLPGYHSDMGDAAALAAALAALLGERRS